MLRHDIVAGILNVAFVVTGAVVRADDRPYAIPFTPEWAAPQLDMSPRIGPPGTEIYIFGTRFHADVGVFYGDLPMPILERGKRYIIAVIPPHPRRDDFIYVVDNTGRARTDVPFH